MWRLPRPLTMGSQPALRSSRPETKGFRTPATIPRNQRSRHLNPHPPSKPDRSHQRFSQHPQPLGSHHVCSTWSARQDTQNPNAWEHRSRAFRINGEGRKWLCFRNTADVWTSIDATQHVDTNLSSSSSNRAVSEPAPHCDGDVLSSMAPRDFLYGQLMARWPVLPHEVGPSQVVLQSLAHVRTMSFFLHFEHAMSDVQ